MKLFVEMSNDRRFGTWLMPSTKNKPVELKSRSVSFVAYLIDEKSTLISLESKTLREELMFQLKVVA